MLATVENANDLKSVIEYIPFDIQVKADYTTWGKAEADITDVLLVFKKNNSDANDKYLQKQHSVADIAIDDATKVFTISIQNSDFTNLKPDTYSIRMGILFNGETQYRDVNEIENGIITIQKSWFDYVEPLV